MISITQAAEVFVTCHCAARLGRGRVTWTSTTCRCPRLGFTWGWKEQTGTGSPKSSKVLRRDLGRTTTAFQHNASLDHRIR